MTTEGVPLHLQQTQGKGGKERNEEHKMTRISAPPLTFRGVGGGEKNMYMKEKKFELAFLFPCQTGKTTRGN